jgi:hypothetical protein
MYYVVELLYAQRPEKGRRRVLCESCHVILSAASAVKCYDRALKWAKRYEKEGSFEFVGVQWIRSLDTETLHEGLEIGGRFFNAYDVWDRLDKFIPKKNEIPAILWELKADKPIGELMTSSELRTLRRVFKKK